LLGVLLHVVADGAAPPPRHVGLVRDDRHAELGVLREAPQREPARGALRLALLRGHGDDQPGVRRLQRPLEGVVDEVEGAGLDRPGVEGQRHLAGGRPLRRGRRRVRLEHAGGVLDPVQVLDYCGHGFLQLRCWVYGTAPRHEKARPPSDEGPGRYSGAGQPSWRWSFICPHDRRRAARAPGRTVSPSTYQWANGTPSYSPSVRAAKTLTVPPVLRRVSQRASPSPSSETQSAPRKRRTCWMASPVRSWSCFSACQRAFESSRSMMTPMLDTR